MAQGDLVLFTQFKTDLCKKLEDFSADVFKLGLINNGVTPSAATSDARWGAGGGTNLSSNEVTPGGNYSAGGPTIGSTTLTGTTTVKFSGNNISILQNASNPTNARWAILYDSTDAGKRCVGFVDLGAVLDLTLGDLTITVNANGFWTLT